MPPWNRLSNRIPNRSQLLTVFLTCLFPIQAWSWFAFLYQLPSYLLSLSIGQTLVVFAYLQVAALVEAALLFLGILAAAILLPRSIMLDRLIPQTLALVLSLACWTIGLHYRQLAAASETAVIGSTATLAWSLTWLAILVGASWLIRRRERFAARLADIADRLSVLAGFYLAVNLIALAGLIVRFAWRVMA